MSELFKLDWLDLGRSLFIAFIAAVLGAIYPIIDNGALPGWPEIQAALMVGLGAAVAYLLKRLLSNATGEIFGK